MSKGKVLSACIDEDGKAKVLLGIDSASDGDDLIEDTGAAAREKRKARAKSRAEAAAAKLASETVECLGASMPAPRPGGPKTSLNPFAKPLEIELDATSAPVEAKKGDNKKNDRTSRSRSRSARRKQKRLAKLAEKTGAGGLDQALLIAEQRKLAGTSNRNAGMDLSTGGTAIGPMSTGPEMSGKVGLCIKFLSDDCPMTAETCEKKHCQDPADKMKWLRYFNTQSCKHGVSCQFPKCIYDHPNRRGWCGENVNLVVGATL